MNRRNLLRGLLVLPAVAVPAAAVAAPATFAVPAVADVLIPSIEAMLAKSFRAARGRGSLGKYTVHKLRSVRYFPVFRDGRWIEHPSCTD